MATLFALFAEVERDLISERTREGLARARSSGRKLGRPPRHPASDRPRRRGRGVESDEVALEDGGLVAGDAVERVSALRGPPSTTATRRRPGGGW